MGDWDNYYRHRAEEAEEQAARAISPEDRAAWLRLAKAWLALISRKPPGNEVEGFDGLVQQIDGPSRHLANGGARHSDGRPSGQRFQ